MKAALGAREMFVGQVIEGKYVLHELLREGGFALVYRADEVANGQVVRPVAVKLIYPDPKVSREKQAEELTATLRMSHPNIVRGLSAGMYDLNGMSWLYLVMELAEESLDERIRRKLLSAREAWEMTEQIGSGLAYLHKDPDRLVHRDLKPANILCFDTTWKLADFGLAYTMEWLKDAKDEPSGGTEKYMPPEAYDGGVISPAWDIWAFGVMLAQAMTGKHPFECDRHILFAITQLEPELPADLPIPFLQIIRGCLIKKRTLRWTAPQVLATLNAARGTRASFSAYRWNLKQRLRHMGDKTTEVPQQGRAG